MKLPAQPPQLAEIMKSLSPEVFVRLAGGRPETEDGAYLHWDELRRRRPPPGLSAEQWWMSTVWARTALHKELPLVDKDRVPFRFASTDTVQQRVHRIDRDASGRLSVEEPIANPAMRDRYIVNSLIEEAITSSQLEGASTTRRVAKEMIRSGRRPRTDDEQMILNNYEAMEFIRRHESAELTPGLILELHRILTVDTELPEEAIGRLRRPEETVHVVDDGDGQVLHVPPPAGELPDRMAAMCEFANGSDASPDFFHPVVRSILLHFWLAYDHPFADGNGRTARALFYWSMLRRGYWLTAFLSISRLLKKAPARYNRAFLYTETDNNDTTYFVLHQLGIIERAIDELHRYLERKIAEVRQVEERLREEGSFNHRQLALLSHALRHPDAVYTVASHQRSHDVVYETARRDLQELEDRGLLRKVKRGRFFHFYPHDLTRLGGR